MAGLVGLVGSCAFSSTLRTGFLRLLPLPLALPLTLSLPGPLLAPLRRMLALWLPLLSRRTLGNMRAWLALRRPCFPAGLGSGCGLLSGAASCFRRESWLCDRRLRRRFRRPGGWGDCLAERGCLCCSGLWLRYCYAASPERRCRLRRRWRCGAGGLLRFAGGGC